MKVPAHTTHTTRSPSTHPHDHSHIAHPAADSPCESPPARREQQRLFELPPFSAVRGHDHLRLPPPHQSLTAGGSEHLTLAIAVVIHPDSVTWTDGQMERGREEGEGGGAWGEGLPDEECAEEEAHCGEGDADGDRMHHTPVGRRRVDRCTHTHTHPPHTHTLREWYACSESVCCVRCDAGGSLTWHPDHAAPADVVARPVVLDVHGAEVARLPHKELQQVDPLKAHRYLQVPTHT